EGRIGFDRLWIRIGDEENERLDKAMASLSEEAYLLHHAEKVLEHAMADIDDVRAMVVCEQPVEKCHLPAGIIDIGNRRDVWQIIRQLRTFVGQIEGRHGSIIDHVELSEQPRNQGLSDATTRRANDVERSGLAGHGRRIGHSSPPAPRRGSSASLYAWCAHQSAGRAVTRVTVQQTTPSVSSREACRLRYVAIFMTGRGLPIGGSGNSLDCTMSVRPTRSYSAHTVSSQ